MGKERRRLERYKSEFNGSLYLCNKKSGHRVSSSLDCRSVDFSRRGVGIATDKIFVDKQHFFYAALDSNDVLIVLEIVVPDNSGSPMVLSFRGNPVWFDRLLGQELKPFRMGIEFLEKVSREEWSLLKQFGVVGRKSLR